MARVHIAGLGEERERDEKDEETSPAALVGAVCIS